LHADNSAVLVLELSTPPQFYRGTLQQNNTTMWDIIDDFTDGQAITARHQVLHFPRPSLTDPLERLLNEEPRLKELARQGLSADPSHLYFREFEDDNNFKSLSLTLQDSMSSNSPESLCEDDIMSMPNGGTNHYNEADNEHNDFLLEEESFAK